jgi:hypothetical protein
LWVLIGLLLLEPPQMSDATLLAAHSKGVL